VTTAAEQPAGKPYPVHWVSRHIPVGLRHAASTFEIARRAREADVVYCTGMVGRTGLALLAAHAPLVLKITSDPAYERSLRYALHTSGLDEFQYARGVRVGLLRRLRDMSLGRAARIVAPSAALRDIAIGWGVPPEKVEVLPNPVEAPDLASRNELRRRHGLEGPTLVFAGRIAPQKSLDVMLEAVRLNEGVHLVVAGDGPEQARVEAHARQLGLGARARFLGPQAREAVFELLRAADAAVLSSSWENFPHMVVEALAVSTPVIATSTGGVREIVEDGVNGLLVPPQDPDALAAAIARYFSEPVLQKRLRAAAAESVQRFAPGRVYGRLEAILCTASSP
jgi:glycosyltransferase involved in cell wall biosynthesis